MSTSYARYGLVAAVIIVYAACDSGVDVLNDQLDTPPGDVDIDAVVDPPAPTEHPSIVAIRTIREELVAAYDSSGITQAEIDAFEANNDLSGAAEALGMTADEAEESWELYQTHMAILEAEFGSDLDRNLLLPDVFRPDPPVDDPGGYAPGPCEEACAAQLVSAMSSAVAAYNSGRDECKPDTFWENFDWPLCMFPHKVAYESAKFSAGLNFAACIVVCKLSDEG